jgi:hypothetical protein
MHTEWKGEEDGRRRERRERERCTGGGHTVSHSPLHYHTQSGEERSTHAEWKGEEDEEKEGEEGREGTRMGGGHTAHQRRAHMFCTRGGHTARRAHGRAHQRRAHQRRAHGGGHKQRINMV